MNFLGAFLVDSESFLHHNQPFLAHNYEAKVVSNISKMAEVVLLYYPLFCVQMFSSCRPNFQIWDSCRDCFFYLML